MNQRTTGATTATIVITQKVELTLGRVGDIDTGNGLSGDGR